MANTFLREADANWMNKTRRLCQGYALWNWHSFFVHTILSEFYPPTPTPPPSPPICSQYHAQSIRLLRRCHPVSVRISSSVGAGRFNVTKLSVPSSVNLTFTFLSTIQCQFNLPLFLSFFVSTIQRQLYRPLCRSFFLSVSSRVNCTFLFVGPFLSVPSSVNFTFLFFCASSVNLAFPFVSTIQCQFTLPLCQYHPVSS